MERTVDQMLQQGVAAHNAGNPQEAERLYRAILEVQPKHPDANHNLGLIAVSMNQSVAALTFFKTAVETNSSVEQFWLTYIEALISLGQFEIAKQALEAGKKKGVAKEKLKALTQKLELSKAEKKPAQAPSQVEMQELIINHYQNGLYSEAEALALSITKQFPDRPFSWKILGGIYKALGRMSDALAAGKKAVELDPGDSQAHNSLGVILEDLDRFEEAEISYRESIKLEPDDAETQTNLGIMLQGLGRLEEAEASYRQAIVLKPGFAESHNSLGNVLKELGRLEEAEKNYRRAIVLKPEYADAHYNLGIIELELDRLEEAEASNRKAIEFRPDYIDAHYNLGITLQAQCKLEEAVECFIRTTVLKPDFAAAHNNTGSNLQKIGRYVEAEARHRQAIALKPDYADAHYNLGIALRELGRLEEAEASCRQAIRLKPDFAEVHNNLASTLRELGRLGESEASCRLAIKLKADFAEAHYNLGVTLKDLGRLEEAEASCGQSIALKPGYAEAKFTKSLLLLNRQEFQLGWPLYISSRDPKLEFREFEVTPGSFIERAERWKGTSLRGKNIQVHSAQGVGDEILFSSCIPDLIHEFPSKIYLECDPRLEPLFARSFPEVIVYGRERKPGFAQSVKNADMSMEDVHFDYSMPIDGLPQFFRTKIEDFPSRDAFLVPDPESVDKWEKRLAGLGEGLKIGISWLGGTSRVGEKQSIPLANWVNLLSVDALFVNLQYGNTSDEVAKFSAEHNIVIYDWEDNDALLDLDNQAALISTLDLVISVDNATVHSCIALGTEVWNLITPSLFLMWMTNGTGISPLSRHVRFFEKKDQDSWVTVLSHFEEKLLERISVE